MLLAELYTPGGGGGAAVHPAAVGLGFNNTANELKSLVQVRKGLFALLNYAHLGMATGVRSHSVSILYFLYFLYFFYFLSLLFHIGLLRQGERASFVGFKRVSLHAAAFVTFAVDK